MPLSHLFLTGLLFLAPPGPEAPFGPGATRPTVRLGLQTRPLPFPIVFPDPPALSFRLSPAYGPGVTPPVPAPDGTSTASPLVGSELRNGLQESPTAQERPLPQERTDIFHSEFAQLAGRALDQRHS